MGENQGDPLLYDEKRSGRKAERGGDNYFAIYPAPRRRPSREERVQRETEEQVLDEMRFREEERNNDK